MFNSIQKWMNRSDDHQADRNQLEAEARQFKLPSETLPQIFKYLFFIGLGFLNYRLFAHAVPGAWGTATGILAMMAEAIALYCTHNFSRSAGAFRIALGACGGVLMAFLIVHGTFSILDLIGIKSLTRDVQWYSHVVAFPLLSALIGVSVVAITMTHPKNLVRLRQAHGHTRIATSRAEVASELELQRAERILGHAKIERLKDKSRSEAELMTEVRKFIALEREKRELVKQVEDPTLRASLAHELNIDLTRELAPTTYSDRNSSGRADLD